MQTRFFKEKNEASEKEVPRAPCCSVALNGLVRTGKQGGDRAEAGTLSWTFHLLVLPAGFVFTRKSTPANVMLGREASGHEDAHT